MAEYNPSKIIKDGNTYNFRDTTKIPLAGTNALAGSIVPSADNSVDLGSSSKNIKMLYTKGITINGTQFLPSDYIPRSGGAVLAGQEYKRTVDNSTFNVYGGNGYGHGAFLQLTGKDDEGNGEFNIQANNGSVNGVVLKGKANGTLTWGSKNVAMQEDVVPRSGGAVMAGSLARNVDNSVFEIKGGLNHGAIFGANGKDNPYSPGNAYALADDGNSKHMMIWYSDGSLAWDGQPIQYGSDQRLKQQITKIDDKLLDAWEDVAPVQFKYNDAVDQKKDKARLHTGYVVQQIDEACKSHGVDISDYGLYCHEEYPQEVEEVEIEQADGTKVKEKKVIREASEHYSLRYTEALIVECAYLRKKLKELTTRIEQLESSK